jgi:hypothetical protein
MSGRPARNESALAGGSAAEVMSASVKTSGAHAAKRESEWGFMSASDPHACGGELRWRRNHAAKLFNALDRRRCRAFLFPRVGHSPAMSMNLLFPPLSSVSRWRAFARAMLWLSSAFCLPTPAPAADATDGASQPAGRDRAGGGDVSVRKIHCIDDLNLELIGVAPGTFMMGSPPNEPGRNKAEGPQMRVTLTHGFWLGRMEVTQAQYEKVTGSNPSRFTAAGKDAPVEEASWIDAMEFCRMLTARERAAGRLPEGYAFTLPTEAQWEYACRAGTTGAYAGNPEAMAWHKNNSGETTHPVGTKQPNAWGFHDMYGNVLEWCLDWYGDYQRGDQTDPAGPDSGYFRIARGGSWRVELFRSASRGGGSAGRRDYTLGFRLALARERSPGRK